MRLKACLACVALALGLAGCAYQGSVNPDFYKPTGQRAEKIPISLAIIADERLRASQFPSDKGDIKINIGNAVVASLQRQMSNIVRDVNVVDSPEQAHQNDWLVVINLLCDNKRSNSQSCYTSTRYSINIAIKDHTLSRTISEYNFSAPLSYNATGGRSFIDSLNRGSPIILSPISIQIQADSYTKALEEAIAASVTNIGAQMTADGRLRDPRVLAGELEPAAVKTATPMPMPARFPVAKALALSYRAVPPRAEDIAVIIGNSNYRQSGMDIPNVAPAHADAAAMRRYAVEGLGIREGNVIDLRDATGSQLVRVFGSRDNPNGQLSDWVRPNRSRVFVYYSGHGAPGTKDSGNYLVPTDVDAARIELGGYPLKTLYDNLAKLPAQQVTVVIEACFSGMAQGGSLIGKASPIRIEAVATPLPARLSVITAGAANQVASWEEDGSYSLFTKFFLMGQAGEADKAPFGNGDGRVAPAELEAYLKENLTYYARRYYGREQTAEFHLETHE